VIIPVKISRNGLSGELPTFARGFMAMRVMSGLTVEFSTVLCWTLASGWESTVIAFTEVIVMIDVSVKMFRAVEPWPRSDEDTA
jgi:hypothetical protein